MSLNTGNELLMMHNSFLNGYPNHKYRMSEFCLATGFDNRKKGRVCMDNWKELYHSRTMSAKEAVTHIKDGDRVINSHLVGAPLPIIDAMLENYASYKDVEISCMLTSDGQPFADEKYKGHFHMNPWFVGKASGKALAEGYAEFTPSHFSEVPYLLRNTMKPDVALIQVSPPDEHGYMSMGLSTDYAIVAARLARTVIAEVNQQCPRLYGDTLIHVSQIECIVESNREIPSAPATPITDVERAIGGYCAELIDNGACLQLGIGAIPDAVLSFLDDKRELGIHSEIIGDGVKHLCEIGVVTGEHKEVDKGKVVATSLYGSKELLQYANNNPVFELYPVDYTNDVRVISKISNMVSINSCVEIDFTGQVCSEAVGPRQISGIGGQVDFVRGAKMSEGGKSIIACYSTAKGGTISKIVPMLAAGTPVTTSRTDVDYVITEYGIAHLRGLSTRARAKALIAIAHPKFRDQLTEEFNKLFPKV